MGDVVKQGDWVIWDNKWIGTVFAEGKNNMIRINRPDRLAFNPYWNVPRHRVTVITKEVADIMRENQDAH